MEAENTSELEIRPRSATGALGLSTMAYSEEHRAMVAEFLGVDKDEKALIPFFAVAAQYGLDPFLGEIWLINTAKYGSTPKWQASVGRDGLLKAARAVPSYESYEADVVCEKDEFIVTRDPQRHDNPQIYHRVDGAGAARGEILGAYCKVFIQGQRPTYYFAPLKEHARWTTKNGKQKWTGAWGHTSAMILKSAVSYAHRLAIGVTGIIPVDEMPGRDFQAESEAEELPDLGELAKMLATAEGIGDERAEVLAEVVEIVNGLAPHSWGEAKLQVRLKGRGPDAVELVIAEIDAEILAARERLTEKAEEAQEQDAVQILRADDVQVGQIVKDEDGLTQAVESVGPGGVDGEAIIIVFEGTKEGEHFEPGYEFELVGVVEPDSD